MRNLIIGLLLVGISAPLWAEDDWQMGPQVGKITAGSNITLVPPGGKGDVTIQTPTKITTETFTFMISSTVYASSAPFVSFERAYFVTGMSTINIVDVCAYCLEASSVSTTRFGIVRSTANTTKSYSAIHSSSFSVSSVTAYGESSYSPVTAPNAITRVLAFQSLALQVTDIPLSGKLPESCGAIMRYWREQP